MTTVVRWNPLREFRLGTGFQQPSCLEPISAVALQNLWPSGAVCGPPTSSVWGWQTLTWLQAKGWDFDRIFTSAIAYAWCPTIEYHKGIPMEPHPWSVLRAKSLIRSRGLGSSMLFEGIWRAYSIKHHFFPRHAYAHLSLCWFHVSAFLTRVA